MLPIVLLIGPHPVGCVSFIDAVFVCVIAAFDLLVEEPLPCVTADSLQLVAANVPVVVVVAPVRQPKAFASRKNDEINAYTGAWRAYYTALVDAGVYVGGDPLEAPETGTTIRIVEGKRRVQDGPYADTKEQLGGFTVVELPSLDAALDWATRCPAASLAR